jgi:transcription elongation factor S-II
VVHYCHVSPLQRPLTHLSFRPSLLLSVSPSVPLSFCPSLLSSLSPSCPSLPPLPPPPPPLYLSSFQPQDATECLELLELVRTAKVTKTNVKKSSIGKIVHKLTKHQNESIKKLAKQVKSTWMQVLGVSRTSSSATPSRTSSAAAEAVTAKSETEAEDAVVSAPSSSEASSFVLAATGDSTRDSIQKKLHIALGTAPDDALHSAVELAVRIETAMHHTCTADRKGYASKYREIAFNLKDKRNPELNARLFKGVLKPAALCFMSGEDMASEETKQSRKESMQYVMDAARTDWEDPNEGGTTMFKCGRCKERWCKYYQKQTRSADEPMTTFITCLKCGSRWKE